MLQLGIQLTIDYLSVITEFQLQLIVTEITPFLPSEPLTLTVDSSTVRSLRL